MRIDGFVATMLLPGSLGISPVAKSGSTSLVGSGGYIYELENGVRLDLTGVELLPATQVQARNIKFRQPVSIKCDTDASGMSDEFVRMGEMSGESWVPRVIEMFDAQHGSKRLKCIAMESLRGTLLSTSFSVSEIMKHGLRMLMITETLHKKFALNHRSATANKWGISSADGRLVLANFRGLTPIKSDPKSFHRIREIHQLGLTLRYMFDSDRRYLSIKNEAKWRGKIVFPRNTPIAFKEMLDYIFSISEEYGEFPERLFTRIRGSLLSLASASLSSGIHEYVGPQFIGNDETTGSFLAVERDGKKVVLKCSSNRSADLRAEYTMMTRLQSERWVPIIFEYFEIQEFGLDCYAMEMLGISISKFSRLHGIIDPPKLARVGIDMVAIVGTLHKKYGLRHGSLHKWMLRDPTDLSSLVLIDFGRARTATPKDRLDDIRSVVATLRHLCDLEQKFFLEKHLIGEDTDVVCPVGICPEPLREIIGYFSTVDEFNESIYSRVTDQLHRMTVGPPARATASSRPLDPAMTLQSGSNLYQLSEAVTDFTGTVLIDAIRFSQGGTVVGEPVSLRCVRPDESIASQFALMERLAGEIWTPRVIELFDTVYMHRTPLKCIAMERIRATLMDPSVGSMEVGVRILSIAEKLHKKYELNHRNAIPSSWGYTASGRFVLIQFSGLMSLEFDKVGYHRIRELHQLVLTMRFLVDRDPARMNRKLINDVSSIRDGGEGVCPPLLTKLAKLAFKFSDEWGEMPPDMYTSLRSHLMSLAGDGIVPGYIGIAPLGKGEAAAVMTARRVDNGMNVVLKCSSHSAPGDLLHEVKVLENLKTETYAPILYDVFEIPELDVRCYAMEKLGIALGDMKGLETSQLGYLGFKMTEIIESLHQTHGLRHSDLHPHNWMLRNKDDLGSLVLIDYGNAQPGSPESFLRDIREIPITIRYIMSNDTRFYFAKRLTVDRIDEICPLKHFPQLLKEIILHALGMKTFDPDIYSNMKHLFELMH
jgi:hypothetical protein